jgi:hypothetical protein
VNEIFKNVQATAIQNKNIFEQLMEFLVSSCASFNRLTSPKPITPKTTEWNYGLTVDPVLFENYNESSLYETKIYAFEPVLGFRRGINNKFDFGLRSHGLNLPQLVIDLKHVFYQRNDFYISGDIALMGVILRSFGPQYDLLVGKEKFYGTIGICYDFMNYNGNWLYHIGTGGMNIGKSRFGWQANVGIWSFKEISGNDLIQFYSPTMRIGIVYNLLPKKYRNPAPSKIMN